MYTHIYTYLYVHMYICMFVVQMQSNATQSSLINLHMYVHMYTHVYISDYALQHTHAHTYSNARKCAITLSGNNKFMSIWHSNTIRLHDSSQLLLPASQSFITNRFACNCLSAASWQRIAATRL